MAKYGCGHVRFSRMKSPKGNGEIGIMKKNVKVKKMKKVIRKAKAAEDYLAVLEAEMNRKALDMDSKRDRKSYVV